MSWWNQHKNQMRGILIGGCVIGGVLFCMASVYLYRQRKATEAEIELRNQNKAASCGYESVAAATTEEIDLSADSVDWNGKHYRRNSYMKAILCIGIDRRDGMTEEKELGEAGQADGLFLLVQDTARNQLKILMIPRDTMTEITTLNSDGSIKGKEKDHLLMAYAYGDGLEGSCLNVTQSVSELFSGFPIDYYLAADTVMIGEMNDAVGGVTVTVPTEGMEKADPDFILGEQITLHGEQAELFVRYRDIAVDHSAIYRMNQQKEYVTQFFCALQEKSKEDSQIVTRLFELAEGHMITNLAKDQYMKIAADLISDGGIQTEDFYMVPGTSVTTDEYDEFHVETDELITLLLELFYREEEA